MDAILELLKLDLGVTHTKRDAYFVSLINGVIATIERRVTINVDEVEDQMLVADYAAWQYRHRQEDLPISKNLQQRLRDRIVKARADRP